MSKKSDDFTKEVERINKELRNISNNGQEKKTTYNSNLFDGGDDIDPSDAFKYWEKKEELERAVKKYPNSKDTIQMLQEKRARLEREKERKKNKRNNRLKSVISAIAAAATLTTSAYMAEKLISKDKDNTKITKAMETLTNLGKDELLRNQLAFMEGDEFVVKNNSVSDYSKLDADTPMEVYIYKMAIDNKEEFNKFIQSVTYENDLYCYTDFDQFLRINGYYDTKTGIISDVVFENYMEATLLDAYNNNTLSSYEEEFYTSNLEEENHRTR